MSDERSPEQIEDSIEKTREQLAEDIDALGEMLSPEALKEQARERVTDLGDVAADALGGVATSVTERAEALGERFVDTLKDEPLPLATLGAVLGVGWLLARSARREATSPGTRSDTQATALLEKPGQIVGPGGYPLRERAPAKDTGNVVQDNGLLIGVAAVALGAAVGLMLPSRRGEAATDPKRREQTKGFALRERVRVRKGAHELYAFWRDLENLPQVMSHLESVTELGGGRSHWVAKGPADISVEWGAIITDERPGESLAWRSDLNSQVPNEGAVGFRRVDDSSTDIIVSLTYHPPGGALGAAVANLFGRSPQRQISDDLERFKERVESGTLLLTKGSVPTRPLGDDAPPSGG